jgi:trigger factor
MSNIEWINDSTVKLEISADEAKLKQIKQKTLKSIQPSVSAPGFRKGKVPLSKVEAQVDDNIFKSQFLDDALNVLFDEQVVENKLRPVGQPRVEIKKFVPYSNLEFTITVDVVGKIVLGDYKKIKVSPEPVKVTKKDVDEVIASLQLRMAEKSEVDRAAKDGDEVWIDFAGKDKSGKEVAGATGKDYPLALGSNTFIKGFEPAIIGMKAGETKDFDVTFPSDYAHKPLADKKVTFTVTLNKVMEVTQPEVSDKFAADAGPFKTVEELKSDIEKQLSEQKAQEADGLFKDKILQKLVESSKIPVPDALVNDQTQVELDQFKQNLTYRGMTLEDYLSQANTDEEGLIKNELKPVAERKVKVGLALSEVASQEKLTVSEEEVAIRIQLLKGQYKDEVMRAQLDAPEAQRDIASRLLSEKTINKLVEYCSKS